MKLPGMDAKVTHPVVNNRVPLWLAVTNLNDHHGWSRDQIADWLDKIQEEGLIDLSFHDKENV